MAGREPDSDEDAVLSLEAIEELVQRVYNGLDVALTENGAQFGRSALDLELWQERGSQPLYKNHDVPDPEAGGLQWRNAETGTVYGTTMALTEYWPVVTKLCALSDSWEIQLPGWPMHGRESAPPSVTLHCDPGNIEVRPTREHLAFGAETALLETSDRFLDRVESLRHDVLRLKRLRDDVATAEATATAERPAKRARRGSKK